MSKRYILDGNNIIHKHPVLRKVFATTPSAARTALVEQLAPFAQRYSSYRFHLVFDSDCTAMASLPHNIAVTSAPQGQSADDVIKRLIRKEKSPAHCVVVSSDTDVYNAARAHACTAVTAEAFLRDIQPPAPSTPSRKRGGTGTGEKPSGVSRAEIATMKKLFGLE